MTDTSSKRIAENEERGRTLVPDLPERGLDAGMAVRLISSGCLAERRASFSSAGQSWYQTIFENHDTVMLIINPQSGRIVNANSAASRFYGWGLDELCQMNIVEINTLPAEDLHAQMSLAQNQRRIFFQFQHRLADGQIRDVESFCTPISWDDQIHLCAMISDVSERKREERELLKTKLNLEKVIAERTEELSAINEELTAQNEEIATLNQILLQMNQTLEQRVEEKIGDLIVANIELTKQYEEIQKNQQDLQRKAEIQAVVREIADAAISTASLAVFYDTVHRILKRVFLAENVYITIWDELNGVVDRPFSKGIMNKVPKQRPFGKGFSEYVMRMGRVAHITAEEQERLLASGEVQRRIENCHEWMGAPLIDPNGKAFGTLSVFSADSSHTFKTGDSEVLSIIAAQVSMAIQRKHAEESLIQSENLQKSVLRAAPVGIGLVRRRVLQSVNERLCSMTGYSEAELVGQDARILYPSDREYEYVGEEKYRQISVFGTGTVETRWKREDGSIIDVLMSSTPLDINDLDKGVTFTALDITTRKRAEVALVESEARYRAVMEQSHEAVSISDPDTGAIIEANSRFTELVGYDLKRDKPISVFDVVMDRRENVEFFLSEVKQNGFSSMRRGVVRHRSGIHVQIEHSATLIRYRERSLLVQTLRDISEEARREMEIRRDAELATRVQNALLKAAEPSEHLDITTIYEPHSYVGGDLYFMDWRYGGNLLRGFIVDAAGHGLATALHTSAMHVLLREVNELDLPLPEQMRWLNRRASQYFDDANFAGALGFELDLQTRQLRWSSAGVPLVWFSSTERQGFASCPGMYLGISPTESFEMCTMPLEQGDSVCFMTDGLSDIVGRLPENQALGYHEMVQKLQEISKSKECHDDATAICIRINSMPNSLVRSAGWPRIIHFNGYGDYQRLKGEMSKIFAEITGNEHSIQEVAVNEALCNAMECRDGKPRQHQARLRVNKVGNRLIVRVKTSRIGFAGNALLQRLRVNPTDIFSFGEDAGMGRGIPIMLSTSHLMMYNTDGTEVLLVWKLGTSRAKCLPDI